MKNDEGIQILRRAEGVHSDAGSGRGSRGGFLPQGRDQPGDLLQLEEEVRQHAAGRNASVEAAGGRELEAAQARGGPLARHGDAAGRHPPKTVRPARKRELVNGVRSDWGVSIRRACRVLEMDTSMYHYKSHRREQTGIEARIREILETRVRYGYRRVHVLLRREGWEINMKRTHRIYNEFGLQLRNKTPKRRVKAKLREDRCGASRVNDVWVMDFVHDQLATGRKIRVLTVVDTFSRFSPVLDPRLSYRGEDVVQTLETTCAVVGYPKKARSTRAPSSSAGTLIYEPTPMA